MKQWLLIFFLSFSFCSASQAEQQQFLPVEQAFPYQWSVTETGLQLHFAVHKGYYLYKSRFQFKPAETINLKEPIYSFDGKMKTDQYFGEMKVYSEPVTITLPYSGEGEIKVRYQGCADKGLCYLPQTLKITLPPLAAKTGSSGLLNQASMLADDTQGLSDFLANASKNQALVVFFLLGLGLSLTPCVLPMVPILSGIIGGESNMNGKKGFSLSLSYVLGMASSYALTGILVTTLAKGINLQAMLQQPWLLTLFAAVFVLLAMAMFGFYELQLPSSLQQKLNSGSDKLGGGKIASVFVMGAISALVVSPCVTAPLAGALLYVSTTQDWLFGGLTLFVMALGMGVPLILIGVSGGRLLPKSGPWMIAVKQFFGVLLLAVAIVLVSRFVPGWATLLLWSLLLVGTGIHFGALESAAPGWPRTKKLTAFMSLFYGLVLFVGALTGGNDPLAPLTGTLQKAQEKAEDSRFTKVDSIKKLDNLLASAKASSKPVLIDLYADWCISCKTIEKEVFGNNSVQQKLTDWELVKLDVTESTAEQMAWLNERNIFGPPAIFFYSPQGEELVDKRIAGAVNLTRFQQQLPKNL